MTPLSLLVMLLGTGHGLEVVVVNVEGGLQPLKLCLQVEALGPLLGCRRVLVHYLLLGLLRVKSRYIGPYRHVIACDSVKCTPVALRPRTHQGVVPGLQGLRDSQPPSDRQQNEWQSVFQKNVQTLGF